MQQLIKLDSEANKGQNATDEAHINHQTSPSFDSWEMRLDARQWANAH